MKKHLSRREFLDRSKQAGLGLAAGITILSNAQSVWAAPANDRIILAQVGCGGRGGSLAPAFAERGDCRYAYCCDPYLPRAEGLAKASQPAGNAQGAFRLPRDAGRQVGRRGGRRHARPLARPGHGLGLPGRQGRLRREAAHAIIAGKAARWSRPRGSTSGSCRWACRTAAPPTTWRPRSTSRRASSDKIHFCRVYNQKEWANFPAEPDSDPPAGFDWDMWNGPAPQAKYKPPARQLAPSLALLGRRHHQRRHPPARHGAVAAGRRLSQGGLRDRGAGSTARARAETPDTQVAVLRLRRPGRSVSS